MCVIGSEAKTKLFSGGWAVGETIRLNGVLFTIVGVLSPKMQEGGADNDRNRQIYIPFSTMSDLADTKYLGGIWFNYQGDYQLTEQNLRDTLGGGAPLPAVGSQCDLCGQPDDATAPVQHSLAGAAGAAFLVGALTLGIAGIGLMNIMLVAVQQRTREIGVEKALGAQQAPYPHAVSVRGDGDHGRRRHERHRAGVSGFGAAWAGSRSTANSRCMPRPRISSCMISPIVGDCGDGHPDRDGPGERNDSRDSRGESGSDRGAAIRMILIQVSVRRGYPRTGTQKTTTLLDARIKQPADADAKPLLNCRSFPMLIFYAKKFVSTCVWVLVFSTSSCLFSQPISFAAPVVIPFPNDSSYSPTLLATGDVNGDGNTDLLLVSQPVQAASTYDPQLTLLTGDGTGKFASRTLPIKPHPFSQFFLTDVNGDGKQDILYIYGGYDTSPYPSYQGNVEVWIGDGRGNFTKGPSDALPVGVVTAKLGDFNGDGKMDLAVLTANSVDGSIAGSDTYLNIYTNSGTGTLHQTQAIHHAHAYEIPGPVADYNGDGRQDMTLIGSSNNVFTILPGVGNGTFTSAEFSDLYLCRRVDKLDGCRQSRMAIRRRTCSFLCGPRRRAYSLEDRARL